MKIDNSTNPKLKEVYKDSFGNKWYTYVDPMEVDAIRGIAAQRAERYIGMMLSESELKLCMDAAIEAAKQNDVVKVYSIIYDIKHRAEFISEENSVLDLAAIYFFLEDENPSELMESYRIRKHKIWQDDYLCRSFFLNAGLSLSERLRNIPANDLLGFMEKAKIVADRIYRHIPQPSERETNSESISKA